MGLIVQKFGGSSVATAERIHRCLDKALAAKAAGHRVVVVVSAMGDTTDDLLELARQVCDVDGLDHQPPKRELDQLLTTGEQVTIALMAMALHARGHEAISFTGGQIGLVTDQAFTKARIQSINKRRILDQLDAGRIVIVAGFQGITSDGDLTTLGRGGSNATLVALGAVLDADACENFTDVDGIYTADPRLVPTARKIDRISYDEMLELSGLGAGVLQTRAVEFAKKFQVPLHVRNSQNDHDGTWIVAETQAMEDIVVSGVALKKDLIRVGIRHVPDRPGVVATIFSRIAAANVVVDDIIQTVSDERTANVSFTVEHGDLADIQPICEALVAHFGGGTVAQYDADLAKVSVVGVGMRSHTGVAHRMFDALAAADVNIENITTSEIKISCIVPKHRGPAALRAVHDAFGLGEAGADKTTADHAAADKP